MENFSRVQTTFGTQTLTLFNLIKMTRFNKFLRTAEKKDVFFKQLHTIKSKLMQASEIMTPMKDNSVVIKVKRIKILANKTIKQEEKRKRNTDLLISPRSPAKKTSSVAKEIENKTGFKIELKKLRTARKVEMLKRIQTEKKEKKRISDKSPMKKEQATEISEKRKVFYQPIMTETKGWIGIHQY